MSHHAHAHPFVGRLATCVAVVLATTALTLLPSTTAHASCPINDPDCDPTPATYTHTATLAVTAPSTGTITSAPAGISCPADCTEAESQETLSPAWPATGWTTYFLTASGGPTGMTPTWSGCDSVSNNQCVVTNDATETVSMAWQDSQPPTVTLSQPASGKVGPTVTVAANASDNVGITKVQFLVDDVIKATDTSAPYSASVPMSEYADGSQHVISARAYDAAGHVTAVTRTVTVDKSVDLVVGAVPAYISSVDQSAVSISTDPDASMHCTTTPAGTSTPSASEVCGAPSHQFLDDAATDGAYAFEVTATDNVGNTASTTRSTVLDTTAPTIAVTAAPKSGVVASRGTFIAHAADANLDTLACALDGRAIACVNDMAATASFAPGKHTFTAIARDKAGNVASTSRVFTSRGKVVVRATKKVHKRRATLRATHIPVAATGTVVFMRGKHRLCKATVHSGTARCRTQKLRNGKYTVSVRYLGSAYYLPARTTLRFRVR